MCFVLVDSFKASLLDICIIYVYRQLLFGISSLKHRISSLCNLYNCLCTWYKELNCLYTILIYLTLVCYGQLFDGCHGYCFQPPRPSPSSPLTGPKIHVEADETSRYVAKRKVPKGSILFFIQLHLESQSPMQSCPSLESLSISANVSKVVQ